MLGSVKLVAPFAAALAIAGCNAGGFERAGGRSANLSRRAHPVPQWQAQNLAHRACPDVRSGQVQCDALILNKSPQDKEPGWGAHDIEAAYNLPSSSKGAGQIVAIVDAYDNPNVASDLAVYRSHYGLPKAKFYKYNQYGQQSHYPKSKPSWAFEIDLDVDMVSAACPKCTIYLIEANGFFNSTDIDQAETEAVKLGAHIVSNSFECSAHCFRPKAFGAPGVTYVASAGDSAYFAAEPSRFGSVVSVGGTLLSRRGSIYSEVVWPDTGGGCATDIPKPSWQHDPGCSGRTDNDVAAVAWEVAVYNTSATAAGSLPAARALPRPLSPAPLRLPATPTNKTAAKSSGR